MYDSDDTGTEADGVSFVCPAVPAESCRLTNSPQNGAAMTLIYRSHHWWVDQGDRPVSWMITAAKR